MHFVMLASGKASLVLSWLPLPFSCLGIVLFIHSSSRSARHSHCCLTPSLLLLRCSVTFPPSRYDNRIDPLDPCLSYHTSSQIDPGIACGVQADLRCVRSGILRAPGRHLPRGQKAGWWRAPPRKLFGRVLAGRPLLSPLESQRRVRPCSEDHCIVATVSNAE